MSPDFMEGLICRVGLVPDARGEWLYGNASKYMVPVVAGNAGALRVGLWQDPSQMAAALSHLASLSSTRPVQTYIEVGVYAAWTTCIIAAVLRRTSSDHAFAAAAVDVTKSHISQGTGWLLRRLNVSFVWRAGLDDWLGVHTRMSAGAVDVCFIDGNHSYAAVRADYDSLSPRCRNVMFHDIEDASTLIVERHRGGGGVPSLWQQLVASTRAERRTAFTMQHSVQGPHFGIGFLGPRTSPQSHLHRAVPDEQATFGAWGTTGEQAWESLCRVRPDMCQLATARHPYYQSWA